jgi:hypothetical protein
MISRAARRAPAFLALAVFLLLYPGCSSGPSATGTVTFNGETVDNGSIIFRPESDTKVNAAAKIVDGKFTIPSGAGLTTGKNRVEIYWDKKTGKKVNTPGDEGNLIDETVQVLPAQFNSASGLKEEVKAGANTFTFDLKATTGTSSGQEAQPGKGVQTRSRD